MKPHPDPQTRTVVAGILAWIFPGGGHFYLGYRGFGWVYFAAITFVFVVGALVGGVKANVHPAANGWLFAAEILGIGSYTGVGFLAAQMIGSVPTDRLPEFVAYYPASDVAQVYLAVAGLLNVLAILDALARAQTGGQPVFAHELKPEPPPTEATP